MENARKLITGTANGNKITYYRVKGRFQNESEIRKADQKDDTGRESSYDVRKEHMGDG